MVFWGRKLTGIASWPIYQRRSQWRRVPRLDSASSGETQNPRRGVYESKRPVWSQRAILVRLLTVSSYTSSIGRIIAKAQITNGGPVILLQPENEYTLAAPGVKFPDEEYMTAVYKQFRDAGIVVPFINNDAFPKAINAPGQPAAMDIYGHDGYPLGFNCSLPNMWPDGKLPTDWQHTHLKQSPSTPYALVEFQGGGKS